ncbi:lytic murein transglycosylase B [Spiribacter halobius]|uniref:Lytic murein transglycosylase B n=1 Tax=Sediminicurvatus halobius TaxID=2182432 RepID=A0A2U2N8F5_9GAMM|nr:lytic murein transglycosylase B [Spiribacter halobius]
MRRLAVALLAALLALGGCAVLPSSGAETSPETEAAFVAFARGLAERHDFEAERIERLLREDSRLQQDIIDAISSPAEALPWYRYRPIFLQPARIEEGVAFWREHAGTLAAVERRFGVPPEIVVAIIGVETRYGRHRGRHRVLDALRTLAFDYPPRADFFRRELEAYFLLAREEGFDPREPRGSYAGAMGIPQFISSSYREYAVDFNDNGRRDLWSEPADAIGSVGNYLGRHGWQADAPIAVRGDVTGSDWQALQRDGLRPQDTIAALRAAGVTPRRRLPDGDAAARLLVLEGQRGDEHWVTLENFYVITRYNHSPLYAMAVLQLSREIREGYR